VRRGKVMDWKSRNFNAYLSYSLSFVMSLLNGMLTPIIPLLGLSMGASQIELGLLGSAAYLIYIPLSSATGRLSDRLGRKSLIVASGLVYAVACIFYYMSSSPIQLIGARVVDGLAMALLWPAAEALLAESVALEPREMVSDFGVSWSFGAAIGALISSWVIGARRYSDVFLPASLVSSAFSIVALSTVSVKRANPGLEGQEVLERNARTPLQLKSVWMTAFLYAFCQGIVFALYPPYAELRGVSGLVIGLAVTSLMTGRTLVFLMFRKISVGFNVLAMAGSGLMGLAALPLAFVIDAWTILLSSLIFGLGAGLAYSASIQAALSVDSTRRGTYAGFFEGSIGAGYLFGPVIGGPIAQFVLQGPYVVCSVASLAAFVGIVRSRSKSSPI